MVATENERGEGTEAQRERERETERRVREEQRWTRCEGKGGKRSMDAMDEGVLVRRKEKEKKEEGEDDIKCRFLASVWQRAGGRERRKQERDKGSGEKRTKLVKEHEIRTKEQAGQEEREKRKNQKQMCTERTSEAEWGALYP
jgi:hypothetical protein